MIQGPSGRDFIQRFNRQKFSSETVEWKPWGFSMFSPKKDPGFNQFLDENLPCDAHVLRSPVAETIQKTFESFSVSVDVHHFLFVLKTQRENTLGVSLKIGKTRLQHPFCWDLP